MVDARCSTSRFIVVFPFLATGCNDIAHGVGNGLGKGLDALAVVVTAVVAAVTLLAWALLRSTRRHPQRQALGLFAVLVVHLLPIPFAALHCRPSSAWSLVGQWRAWGAVAAWSIPGLTALLWQVPSFSGAEQRTRRAVRGLIIVVYGVLIGGLVYLHRPLALSEPLVEIVTTPRQQGACGLTNAGSVICLGALGYGQIAPSDRGYLDRPRKLDALSPAMEIFMGDYATCGLSAPSKVRCVGHWQGRNGQSWQVESSLVIANTLIDDRRMIFVSPTGALESWSGSERVAVAPKSTQAMLCCSAVLFRSADGRAKAHYLETGNTLDFGPAREIACAELSHGECRVVALNEAMVRFSQSLYANRWEGEIEVPTGTHFVPTEEGKIALAAGDRWARCELHSAGLFGVSQRIGCTWQQGVAKRRLLRGTAYEMQDQKSCRELAALTLRLGGSVAKAAPGTAPR